MTQGAYATIPWAKGPDAAPLLQALRFGRDPFGFLDGCRARYGDTFVLRLPGEPPIVVTSEPRLVRQLFSLRAESFRSERLNLHINMGRSSLAFQDGERHRRTRRAVQPSLHGDALRAYDPAVVETIDAHIQALRAGDALLLHPWLQELTMDVFLGTVFGAVDGARRVELREMLRCWLGDLMSPPMQMVSFVASGHRLRRALDAAVERLHDAPLSASLLAPLPVGRALVAKQRMEVLLREDVRRLREQPDASRTDVLARLVATRDEDGRGLDDGEIVDQLVTLLTGGHETTAATLSWTMDLLLRHPEALARATQEARDVTGRLIDAELPWTFACVQEAMRLRPAGVATPRYIAQEVVFEDGRALPADVFAWACTYLVQQREDLYPDPSVFRPERFIAATPAAGTYLPFGGGLRRCLGVAFAEREMTLVIARLLQRLELRLAPSAAAETTRAMFRGVTLTPHHRVPVEVVAVRRSVT